MQTLLQILIECLKRGEALAAVTIVSHEGSTPRTAGSKMLVDQQGALVAGSVGGGLLEAAALKAAPKVLKSGVPELMDFDLSGELAAGADMICGGKLKVFVEAVLPNQLELFQKLDEKMRCDEDMLLVTALNGGHSGQRRLLCPQEKEIPSTPEMQTVLRAARGALAAFTVQSGDVLYFVEPWQLPPHMILCGGGHVSQATATVAAGAGFTVTVLDDRAEFASAERFPGVPDCRCIPDFKNCFEGIRLNGRAYVVILTRGHVHDANVLEQTLDAGRKGHIAKYIGMIGSVRKRDEIYIALRNKGFSDSELARVHCPVGLPIGAETPGEIAVSIVAECIAHRRAKNSEKA